MKLITCVVTLVFSFNYTLGQTWPPGIDSLYIIPTSPFMNNEVSLVIHSSLSASPCELIHDSTAIEIIDNLIVIETHYWTGWGAAGCLTIDTISLGLLAGGHYELITNFDHEIFTDSDSLDFFVGPATGLSALEREESKLHVFPNPATEQFTLRLSQPATVEIRDMAGRVVKQLRLGQGANTVDIQELKKGVYHVIARMEDWYGSEKLVVH